MNLQYRPIVLPALLAAAALALTGCSGESTANDSATALPLGPISQRMAELEKQNSDAEAAWLDEFDELVATCMKEQGFNFVPFQRSPDLVADSDMPDWDSEEYAKTYGYGITTGENMPGAQKASDASTSEIENDPAYQEALWGTHEGEIDEDDPYARRSGGCYEQAVAQGGMAEVVSSTVGQDIDNLTLQAEEDDAVVAALDEWSTCMANKGYDYETREGAQDSISDRLYDDDDERITGDDLKALTDEEIATAVADYQCSADVRRVRATVLAQLETDYYAEHKAEVDAYLALAEESTQKN